MTGKIPEKRIGGLKEGISHADLGTMHWGLCLRLLSVNLAAFLNRLFISNDKTVDPNHWPDSSADYDEIAITSISAENPFFFRKSAGSDYRLMPGPD